MKKLMTILFALMLCIGALSASAELITDSYSGAYNQSVSYSYYDIDNPWATDWIYAYNIEYSAWYDTETGEGFYSYWADGYAWDLYIEYQAVGGLWYQTSYYGEGFIPGFSIDFWSQVYGMGSP